MPAKLPRHFFGRRDRGVAIFLNTEQGHVTSRTEERESRGDRPCGGTMVLPPERDFVVLETHPVGRDNQDGTAGICGQILQQILGPTALSRRSPEHGEIMCASGS